MQPFSVSVLMLHHLELDFHRMLVSILQLLQNLSVQCLSTLHMEQVFLKQCNYLGEVLPKVSGLCGHKRWICHYLGVRLELLCQDVYKGRRLACASET